MACKKIEIPSLPFIKIQLHLAKYPHCAVNGLMLACKRRFSDEHILEFVDAIPLFHECLHLTPMLEIALIHIDSYCTKNQLFIAGYYEASDLLSPKPEVSLFSVKVAEKIKSQFSESRLVVVNNQKLPDTDSLIFYSSDSAGKKWVKSNDKVEYEDVSNNLSHLLDRKVYRDLIDFDNHLCDMSQHWLNHPINQLIKMG